MKSQNKNSKGRYGKNMNKTRVLCKAQCPICKKTISKKWLPIHISLRTCRKHILSKHERDDVEPLLHKIKIKDGKFMEHVKQGNL